MRALALTVGALLLLLADSAQAGLEFSSPQPLSPTETTPLDPQLATDSQGRTTVVWFSTGEKVGIENIRIARIEADGTATPPETLASITTWTLQNGPAVAVGGNDLVTVAWQSYDGSHWRIEATQLDAEGGAGPVHTLSAPGVNSASQQVAVDSSGRATVVWRQEGSPATIEAARLKPGEAPEDLPTLSPPGVDAEEPDLVVDGQDRVTATWGSDDGTQTVRLDAEGNAEPVLTLSPAGEAGRVPQLAVDGADAVRVAWRLPLGDYMVKSARIGADGTPGPAQEVSLEGLRPLNPRIAVDAAGRATIVWPELQDRVRAVRIDPDGTVGAPKLVSDIRERVGQPAVAAAADGRAIVTWTHTYVVHTGPPWPECLEEELPQPSTDVVHAVAMGPDGSLGEVVHASQVGRQSFASQLTVDPDGIVNVVWHSYEGTYFCVEPLPDGRVFMARGALVPDLPEEEPETEPDGPPAPSEEAATTAPEAAGNPVAATVATLRLGGRALTRGRHAVVPATCLGSPASTCTGTVRLLIGSARVSRMRATARRRAGRRAKPLLLARGSYRLAGRRHRSIALRLSRAGRRLLARRGRGLKVRVTGGNVEGRATFVTAPARRNLERKRRRGHRR